MRLINADKAENDITENITTKAVSRVVAILQGQPTIDAIPIEWIKNIINTNIYLWEQNKERMFVDQGVVKVVNYSITAQILSELIDRWEKENGADK